MIRLERRIATAFALLDSLGARRRGATRERSSDASRVALYEYLRMRSHARHAAAIALAAARGADVPGARQAAELLQRAVATLDEVDHDTRWDAEDVGRRLLSEMSRRDLGPDLERLGVLASVKPVHVMALAPDELSGVQDMILERLATRLAWYEAGPVVGDSWERFSRETAGDDLAGRGDLVQLRARASSRVRRWDGAFEEYLPPGRRSGFDEILQATYERHFPVALASDFIARVGQGRWFTIQDLPWGARESDLAF